MNYAAGIDLGGTQIKAVAVGSDGQVLDRRRIETRDGESSLLDWTSSIRFVLAAFADSLNGPADVVGLATPGLVSADGLRTACLPGKLNGLENVDWQRKLQTAAPVPVLNDAHAALWGEAWTGAAAPFRNAILLTLGTGVGGAILSEGRLLKGTVGRAGHLGHVCLNPSGPRSIMCTPGALEDAIGNRTVASRSGGRFASTEALVEAVRRSDAEAQAVWEKSVHALACALASFINILDPEAIIIGGGIAHAGKDLFAPLEAELASIEWQPNGHRVPLIPAALGEWSGAIGAARNAISFAKEL